MRATVPEKLPTLPLTRWLVLLIQLVIVPNVQASEEDAPETKLPEITVEEIHPADYRPTWVTGATKIPVPPLEVPQTVNTVERTFLDHQQADRLQDVIEYVPGVNEDIGFGGFRDDFVIRGFRSATAFRNGFNDEQGSVRASRDTANIERVEFLKGPASVLYGETEPGGTLVATKQPITMLLDRER